MTAIARRESLGLIAAGLTGLAAPSAWARNPGSRATLYHNGDILTMEGEIPTYVEALVEQDGRIACVGSLRSAIRQFPGAVRHDLKGQTMLPGFVDGHSHFYITGLTAMMANVLPPPDGPAANFETMIAATRAWMHSERGKRFIETFGWVVANGYDDAQLQEQRHPDAGLLDQITRELPVLVIHQSGHVGCLNNRALAEVGYTRATQDPNGGVIRRKADGSPEGLVEEAAYSNVAFRILSRTTPAFEQACLRVSQAAYVAGGYTTAQEARAMPNMTAALEAAAKAGSLDIDVIGYPDIVANPAALDSVFHRTDRRYFGRYRIGGAKLSLDGSPQAKTAWLGSPYFVAPHGEAPGYRGYPALSSDKVLELVGKAKAAGWQLQCHANGDAAIDQFLDAVEAAPGTTGWDVLRPVLVHGQTLRKDQVGHLARLRVLPSLFPAHTFYWGDYHRQSVLGPERAARISPCRDVLNAALTLTSHHDAPVIAPNAMRVLDATVNRTTRSGYVLGPDQCLTPYEGLRSLTAWAAYQCFEEAEKGTLTPGKLADFVILSANPLKVQSSEIHRIEVAGLIKEGRSLSGSAIQSEA